MSLIINGKHINHFKLKRIFKSRIHSITPPVSLTGTQYFHLFASQKSYMGFHLSLVFPLPHLYPKNQKAIVADKLVALSYKALSLLIHSSAINSKQLWLKCALALLMMVSVQ